jgi:hypothetical protein
VLMLALLIVVAVPFLVNSLARPKSVQKAASSHAIRVLRPVTEDEVIAEFLKSDFDNSAFDDYQNALRALVRTPHLEDAGENAKRRALLFIRHSALWRELPRETEWLEVEIRPENLTQVQVFPRAQWRKLARGNFTVTAIVESLRTFRGRNSGEEIFLSKIADLGGSFRHDTDPGAVLLIGLNESQPFTILDGNHRLVSAILTSPETVPRFRFFCGLSPRMTECCWYRTNVATLFRYGTNRLAHVVHNPTAELARLLQSSS